MATILASDAQALFTKSLVDVFKERISPKSFLRSFFRTNTVTTKELSIEVVRGTEKVAVDVIRGTDGNRNQWSFATEKLFVPPYFREYFDLTQLQLYDRLFGAAPGAAVDDRMFIQMLNDSADKTAQLQEKIERAVELQCAQVFESGIVQLQQGINIDYKRKASSMYSLGSGNFWANAVNPFNQLQTACEFLRKTGKVQTFTFDMICGATAIQDLFNNTEFKARQNLFNMSLDNVQQPQANAVGGVYHGTITCGPYRVNIWSYPDFYENASSVMTAYVNAKKVVLIPAGGQGAKFVIGYAAVPQLLKPGQPVKTGQFIISEYMDEKARTHEIHVESAPLAIPTTVDQIVTIQVVA